jgi:hypothetical protein
MTCPYLRTSTSSRAIMTVVSILRTRISASRRYCRADPDRQERFERMLRRYFDR